MTASCASRSSPSAPTAAHGSRANPVRAASAASATDATSCVRSSRRRVAAASIAACTVGQQPGHGRGQPGERHRRLLPRVPAHQRDLPGREVARPQLDPQRHALDLPLGHPAPERPALPRVDAHPHARAAQRLRQLLGDVQQRSVVAHRQHHHLRGRDGGRHQQARVVAVPHDQPADHPGGRAPRRRPGQLPLPGRIQEVDPERPREVLPQLVAGGHLQGLAVAHHGLAGHGVDRPREPLPLGLVPDQHGEGEAVDEEVAVDLEVDAAGVGGGVGARAVRGVPLLPEELAGAQEQPGPQLPPHDVGPLVEQQRQVPVALHPLRHVLADHGLAGGPHDDRLLQLLAAAVRHDRQLGAEPLDVRGLPREVVLGDEQREVGVLRAGRLDPPVDVGLDVLPDRVAVREDHHGAAHRPVVGELGGGEHVLVPTGEVGLPGQHAPRR